MINWAEVAEPISKTTNNKISACADGGPRSRVCARLTLRSAPIDTSGNLSVHVSGRSISGDSKHFSVFHKKTKKLTPQGAGGSPKSYFFCDLKPHAKFQNPTIPHSGRKVTAAERKRE